MIKKLGPFCSWCNVRAIYRGYMFRKFSCESHKKNLEIWDKKVIEPDYSDAAFIGKY